MTDKDSHALEKCAREDSGEKGDKPMNRISNQTELSELPYKVFSKYFQMGGPPLLFVQFFWVSYLSRGSICASMFPSVAYQSHSV